MFLTINAVIAVSSKSYPALSTHAVVQKANRLRHNLRCCCPTAKPRLLLKSSCKAAPSFISQYPDYLPLLQQIGLRAVEYQHTVPMEAIRSVDLPVPRGKLA